MTVNENRKQFEQWTLDYQNQKERADRLFSRISTFRILTFLIGAAGLIIGITEKEKSYATLLVIAGVLFLIGFVALVKWHSVVAERQEMLTEKWEVCRRYCNRFTDGWRKFEEKGTVYLREDDCVAADIDLLGENSLYQMISVCHTEKGKQTFADHLTTRYIEEAERAVDMAQCREIINKLPLGLNTKIGTEGTYLSGGEQQRIVLARAILKNAPIIVLDEATAFADPENEHLGSASESPQLSVKQKKNWQKEKPY